MVQQSQVYRLQCPNKLYAQINETKEESPIGSERTALRLPRYQADLIKCYRGGERPAAIRMLRYLEGVSEAVSLVLSENTDSSSNSDFRHATSTTPRLRSWCDNLRFGLGVIDRYGGGLRRTPSLSYMGYSEDAMLEGEADS